jgi:hypothetical protein
MIFTLELGRGDDSSTVAYAFGLIERFGWAD